MYPLSQALLLNNFHGHLLSSIPKKFQDFCEKYKNIESNSITGLQGGKCVYRTEIRCMFRDMEDELNSLFKYLIPENFHYYDSVAFFHVLGANIRNFIELIQAGGTVDVIKKPRNIAYSIISEYIFKTLFITGFKPTNTLSIEQNQIISEKIVHTKDSIAVLRNVKSAVNKVFKTMTDIERMKLVNDQVVFIFNTNDYRRELFNQIIDISFSIDCGYFLETKEKFIERMLNIYVFEHTAGNLNDYEILKQPLSENNQTQVNANTALKKIFIQQDMKSRSTVTKVLYNLFKDKFEISSDQIGITLVSEYMKTKGILTIYKSTISNKLERANIKYVTIDNNHIEQEIVIRNTDEKKRILNEFKSEVESVSSKIGGIPRDELVRYIHASFKYKETFKRIENILNDFSYGFYPARNYSWIKNKTHQLLPFVFKSSSEDSSSKKNFFLKLMKEVKEWSPEKFTLEDRIDYMKKHLVNLSENQLQKYKSLVEIDIDNWWNSNIVQDIHSKAVDDLFLSAILNNKAYINQKVFLSKLSTEKLNAVVPVRLNNVNSVDNSVTLDITDNDIPGDFESSIVEIPDCSLDQFSSTSFKRISETSVNSNVRVKIPHHKIAPKIRHFVPVKRVLNEYRDKPLKFTKLFTIDSDSDALIDPDLEFKQIVSLKESNDISEEFKFEIKKVKNPFEELFTPKSQSSFIFSQNTDQLVTNCHPPSDVFEVDSNQSESIGNEVSNNEFEYNNNGFEIDPLDNNEHNPHNYEESIRNSPVKMIASNNILQNISNNRQNSISNESLKFIILTKVFSKVRYKKFFASKILKTLFMSSKRPAMNLWNNALNELVRNGNLSKIYIKNRFCFKFNLKTQTPDKFIDHDSICLSISKNLLLLNIKAIKANTLRKRLNSKLRPVFDEFVLYLDDMVTDQNLKFALFEGEKYYSFKN